MRIAFWIGKQWNMSLSCLHLWQKFVSNVVLLVHICLFSIIDFGENFWNFSQNKFSFEVKKDQKDWIKPALNDCSGELYWKLLCCFLQVQKYLWPFPRLVITTNERPPFRMYRQSSVKKTLVKTFQVIFLSYRSCYCEKKIGRCSFSVANLSMWAPVLPNPVTRCSELPGGQLVPFCCKSIAMNIYIDYQKRILSLQRSLRNHCNRFYIC